MCRKPAYDFKEAAVTETTEIILIILLAVLIALVTVFGILILRRGGRGAAERIEKRIDDSFRASAELFRDTVSGNQQSIGRMQTAKFREMDIVLKDMYDTMDTRLDSLAKNMGEIHSLAGGIDDLKRVLTNVKTRGIVGEIRLGAILDELLAPEQYGENVSVVKGSRNVVEFAVKLPGKGGGAVYLPIDSKFPLDAYYSLCAARDTGSGGEAAEAEKILKARLKRFAKDVSEKYISPPDTTDFAIMFLPVEGLYLESIESGAAEEIMREYKVTAAGPTTLAAMLNALQMGFRTLAVEKRSAQVWETLADVRTEFEKFEKTLENVSRGLHRAESELDSAVGVRTRAIIRKLKDIEGSK